MGCVAKRIKLAASSILFFQPDVSKEYNAERQGGGEEAKLRWLTLSASMTYQAAIPDTKICYPATPPPDSTPHVKPKQGGAERLLLAFAHLRQQQRYLTVISGSIDDAKYLVEGAIINLRHPFFLHKTAAILTG